MCGKKRHTKTDMERNMSDLICGRIAAGEKYNLTCDIYIHEEVYKELDEDARAFVDMYKDKNVTIVKEDGLYGTDPQYTTIFNNIAKHELVQYERGRSKDRGEVYSLAYAAYHNMNYFCSKEIQPHTSHSQKNV